MDGIPFDFTWSPDTGFSMPERPQEDEAPQVQPAAASPSRREQRTRRSAEPFDGNLTQNDLLEYENINAIRDYMIRRKGVQYRDMEPEEVVDDFVGHMRFFNANVVSTGGEVRFITGASEEDKASAARAYELYDQLGSVFANDGFFGAVEGIGEYIGAVATDPLTYLSMGVGKLAGGTAITQTGRAAVQAAARAAGERALASGATREAAEQAGQRAARTAADRLARQNVNSEVAQRTAATIARQESDLVTYGIVQRAQEGVLGEATRRGARRSVYATTALDSSWASMQDYTIQNLMIDVGAQEEYSATQTAFASLAGLAVGGAQVGFGAIRGASGLGETRIQLEEARMRTQQKEGLDLTLSDKELEEAATTIESTLDDWMAKVERGRDQFDPNVTPTDLIHDIFLGADKQGGIAKILRDKGAKISRNTLISDVATTVVSQLPESTLKRINEKLQKRVGITLGETAEMGQRLGDLISKDINQAARTLNVASQLRKSIDGTLAHANNVLDGINRAAEVEEAVAKEKARMTGMDAARYGQSVWRRLLVSSPATSAVNVAGFAQFNVGQSLADLLNSGGLTFAGIATMPFSRTKGKEMMRMARVYREIQAQKMRNLLDPFTTHDAYMEFLDANKDVSKALFETFSGGVERASVRFNIDPDAKWFQRTETVTEAMNNVTGVRIQDSFTKSQIFMTELDKNVRLLKDRSLMDVLTDGTLDEIDDEVLSLTLDTTLKSVFSKNYTTDDQLMRLFAKQVEEFSNLPVIGTILPFGRFFNNVVGFTYQWGPWGLATPIKAIMTGQAKSKAQQIGLLEATARAGVGTATLAMAMHYDEQRQKDNLGVYEVKGAGGAIIDAKNTFPFSVFLAAGRVANLMRQDQTVPPELLTELGTQVAVGQFASDVQFGNDLTNILDSMLNFDEGDRRLSFDALYRAGGNIAAGFTRPLDAVNKLAGYITDTDAARDLRQARGGELFTQASTRYVDNIFEALGGRLESVTGEELRVATREGALRDPNPLARIFGITVRPTRTATEQAYSMANMAEWTASERSQIPEYDRMFNTLVAPQLEYRMERLVRNPDYINGNSDTRRVMLQATLGSARRDVRTYMLEHSMNPEQRITALRRKAGMTGNRATRAEALRVMESHGIEAGINDMTYRELNYFLDVVDYLESIYKDPYQQ